jgi:hypothetical protein
MPQCVSMDESLKKWRLNQIPLPVVSGLVAALRQ